MEDIKRSSSSTKTNMREKNMSNLEKAWESFYDLEYKLEEEKNPIYKSFIQGMIDSLREVIDELDSDKG